MKGYRCDRRWGWDCHGLPIETICENALNLRQKSEIHEMGIDIFNEYCRSKVLWYTNEWKTTVERMGKWIEFDNSYKTMDNSYMETIWYIFKRIYNEGYVYKSKKVLLYCPRCETPLSNSEISMDNSYRDVYEQAITVKFKLMSEPNTYLLAWTTTPWTLIGNVALAVNGEEIYSKIQITGTDEFLILMKSRLITIKEEFQLIEEFEGNRLLLKEYNPLYRIYPDTERRGYLIIDGGKDVLSDEGTGIIHIAIYGEFDYEIIEKYELPFIQHIDERGVLIDGPKEWIGTWFKDLDKLVSDDLRRQNLLFSTEEHLHSYPFCYRCETPLIYNALDAWFIKIQEIKPMLLKTNEKINWYPEEISKRYKNIISTAPDWCISRNRFWATAIPVWECKQCANSAVIGSIRELQALALEKVPDDVDLHRHIIDRIHLRCLICGEKMDRIPEVFDCWLESGSMPYASRHYPFENAEEFCSYFPSDFISEYVGQVRAWFYYMHVIAVLLFNEIPFKNVVVNGNILAEDGTKMAKSKRNYPDPNLMIEKYGADALRMYLLSSQLMRAQDLNLREEIIQQVYRRFNLLLVNVIKFYRLFEITNSDKENPESTNILDKWIISVLNLLIHEVSKGMDDYNTAEVSRLLFNFVEDLSTWYLRNSRSRFKSNNEIEKQEAMKTLSYVLTVTSRLLAPLTPFISEMIYQTLKEKKLVTLESVHLESWPNCIDGLINVDLQNKMELTRDIVKKALESRDNAKIPVRQVLGRLIIKGTSLDKGFLDIIADAVNVRNVKLENQEEEHVSIELDTEITIDLKLEGIARNLIRHINNYRKEMGLSISDRIILHLETTDEEIMSSVRNHKDEIMDMTQSDSLIENTRSVQNHKEFKINDALVKVSINVKN